MGFPPKDSRFPSSSRTVVRSGQKSGKGTLKPDHIEILLPHGQFRESAFLARDRMASIRANYQISKIRLRTPAGFPGAHADHPLAVLQAVAWRWAPISS